METAGNQHQLTLTIHKGPVFKRSRQLIISPEFLQSGSKRFDKEEITAFRYGIKWITGYAFTIGREYRIFIQTKTGDVMTISFRTFYGYRKDKLYKQYAGILDALWKHYFSDIVSEHLEKSYAGIPTDICGTAIAKSGVAIPLKRKQTLITWEKLGTKDYHTYYTLFSNDYPADINKHYDYMDDWNATVLYSVVEAIRKQEGE